MKVIGLVTTTRPTKLQAMIDSLSDCDDIIVVEDVERHGMAWARNRLMSLAPAGSIVRFLDDDDIAFSTRRMAERLLHSGVDVLGASYIVRDYRAAVPVNPITACVNRVGPWSWVAKIDSIRMLPWDCSKKVMTGTWQWLRFIEADLQLGMAPDIWCYHWIPAHDGVTAKHAHLPTYDLYRRLLNLINTRGHVSDLWHLVDRISFYDSSFRSRYHILDNNDSYLYDKLDAYISAGEIQ